MSYAEFNSSHIERMNEIGDEVWRQDNLATSDPMFIVQQRRRIWGVGFSHTDTYVWVNCPDDHAIADEEDAVRLDMLESAGEDTGDWAKAGYIDVWDFVTACFTRVGAKKYIAANRHNLREPRVYVASAYRNEEWNDVRSILMSRRTRPEA